MTIRKLEKPFCGVDVTGYTYSFSKLGASPRVFVGGAICKNGCHHDIAIAVGCPEGMIGTKISLDDAEEMARHILDEVSRLRDEKAKAQGKIVMDIGS